jgi:spore coat protein H
MGKRFWAVATALVCGGLALAWVAAGQAAKTKDADRKIAAKDAARDVFGLTRMHTLHLEIAAREWDKMQPTGGMRFPGGPGGPGGRPGGPGGFPGGPPGAGAAAPEKEKDVHKGSGFGMEFPWAHGELTTDGKTYKNLGVRFKGNASYMASARGLKRNLKIDLDHYDNDIRFHGLKTINLNAGAMDPTK